MIRSPTGLLSPISASAPFQRQVRWPGDLSCSSCTQPHSTSTLRRWQSGQFVITTEGAAKFRSPMALGLSMYMNAHTASRSPSALARCQRSYGGTVTAAGQLARHHSGQRLNDASHRHLSTTPSRTVNVPGLTRRSTGSARYNSTMRRSRRAQANRFPTPAFRCCIRDATKISLRHCRQTDVRWRALMVASRLAGLPLPARSDA